MRLETRKKWRTLIQQHAMSDLTISQFCKDNHISPTCFFKYRKILSSRAIAKDNKAFIKIQPPQTNNHPGTIQIQYQQTTLSLPSNLEAVWIANLLKALA